MDLTKDGKEIVWVPGHVSIRGNLAADKDACVGDTSVELIHFQT